MEALTGWWDDLAWGAVTTLAVALAALALGLVWGMAGAGAQLSRRAPLRAAGRGFSLVMRGTPELLIILIVYFGSTTALTRAATVWMGERTYLEIPAFAAGTLALSLVFGGYAAEIIRGAWQAVPKGQVEAAQAIGLRPFAVFRLVRLPQMARFALPGLGNHWISLVKDTSLVSVVGLHDLMGYAKMGTSVTRSPFDFYMAAALIYLALTTGSNLLIRRLERRVDSERPRGAA
ncbi:ABC transporter permease [Haematobacter missouriensis]|uniref:ABC transporter permease n=1 Tax=Haematobacter missouriensis TaxID=366616 RepID=UPI0023F0CFDB|nr:ABC transporter permease subunit [Haematobacter missouriensis]